MEKKNYFNLPYRTVAELLHTDTKCGLSNHQVEERLAEHGYNEFKQREHITLWQKFIGQFKSFMIIVLLVAAAISGITGYMHGEGITDALIILVILVANAIIGALQEAKAEQSLDAHPLQAHCPHLDAVVDGCRALPWRARHERIFQVLHKTPKITINKQAMIGMGAIANIPIHSLIFLKNEVLNILGTKIVIPH